MGLPEQPYYHQLVLLIDGKCTFGLFADEEDGTVTLQIHTASGLLVQEILIRSDGWEGPVPGLTKSQLN